MNIDAVVAAPHPALARALRALDDALVDTAMGLMSNAPAYYALVVEAQVDAGVRHGLAPEQASRLVVQTTPGGSTARGLDAPERGGLRGAFSAALDAILKQ